MGHRPTRRVGRIVIAMLALAILGARGLGDASAATPAQDASPNQAGLVIVHDDGRVVTQCVEFSEAEISGYELLQSSGLDLGIEATGMGASICRINGQGCSPPGEGCFCQCMSSPCLYWSYWRLLDGAWAYANLGASGSTVRPGDVDGWAWAAGVIGREADNQPPAYTFDQICAPPATATPLPTATPEITATPTVTPIPTATFTPFATATSAGDALPASTATSTWTVAPLPTVTSPVNTPAASDALPPQSETQAENATRPVIREFRVDPSQINYGEQAMLTWVVEQATQVTLHPAAGEDANGVDSVAAVGNHSVEPALSTRYTLVALNGAGETRADVMLFVKPSHTTPTPQPTPTLDPALAMAQPATPAPEPTSVPVLPAPEVATATATIFVLEPAATMVTPAAAMPEVAPTETFMTPETPVAAVVNVTPVSPVPEAVASDESEPEADSAPVVVALVPPGVTAPPPVSDTGEQAPNADTGPDTGGETAVVPGPPPPVSAADPEAGRVRLLALITGSALILGAPLLFAFVWMVVWSIWRKS